MTTPNLILMGIAALIIGGIGIEAYLKRGHRRPHAARHEQARPKIELGMEATDISVANAILKRNAAFARKTGLDGSDVSWTETHSIGPEPFPDDETYAARFIGTHRERK